jgi:multiple sugar transport system permease protein
LQLDLGRRWRTGVAPVATERWRVRGAEPYLYLLPALSLTILWTYWPVLGTIQLAFFQWNLLPTTPRIWVGLQNFEQLFGLPELGQAVGNTLIYIVGLVPFSVVFPLGIAIVLNDGRTRTCTERFCFCRCSWRR